jgi:hypothetical protein
VAAGVGGPRPQTGAGVIKRLMCFLVGEASAESAMKRRLVTSVVCALYVKLTLPPKFRLARDYGQSRSYICNCRFSE